MNLPPSRYCAPGWLQGPGTCYPPAALKRSMMAMRDRMTVARTPAIYGEPAGKGLGLFELDPERESTDFMTGFNVAVNKAAIALQERIEERMGITGGADEVVASDAELREPWVPGGVTRASATTPSAPSPLVAPAAVALVSGPTGGAASAAIQGGLIGLVGSMIFAPKKVVAVTAISALVGAIWGVAAAGTPQARP